MARYVKSILFIFKIYMQIFFVASVIGGFAGNIPEFNTDPLGNVLNSVSGNIVLWALYIAREHFFGLFSFGLLAAWFHWMVTYNGNEAVAEQYKKRLKTKRSQKKAKDAKRVIVRSSRK